MHLINIPHKKREQIRNSTKKLEYLENKLKEARSGKTQKHFIGGANNNEERK